MLPQFLDLALQSIDLVAPYPLLRARDLAELLHQHLAIFLNALLQCVQA